VWKGKIESPDLKIQKQTVDRNKKFGYIKYDKQGNKNEP